MYVLSVQYSCAVVSFFLFGGKANLVRFTLNYFTLLTLTNRKTDGWRNDSQIVRTGVSCFSVTLFYFSLFCCGGKANLVRFTLFYSTLLTLTDRQNHRQRNKYTRFAWAGGTFFTVVLLCQFLVLVGNRFWFYILMYLEYNTVVVLC